MFGLLKGRRMLIAAAAGAVAGTLLVSVAPSHATFKGQNGRLVYQAHVGKHAQLFTIKPDGTEVVQVTHLVDSDAAWPACRRMEPESPSSAASPTTRGSTR